MNWREIGVLTDELRALQSASLLRSHQPFPSVLILELRHEHKNYNLLLGFDDDHCRLHLIDERPENPKVPYHFVTLLRARLSPARLINLAATPGDRVVTLDFETIAENEQRSVLRLVCEFTGRHANAFLLDREGIILGSLRQNRSSRRDLMPGRPYLPVFSTSPPDDAPLRFSQLNASFGWNMGAAAQFGQAAQSNDIALRRHALRREIERRLSKCERILNALQRDQEEARKAEIFRRQADLLQIHYGELHSGMDIFEAEDIIAGDGSMLRIALNPALPPRDNIAALYRRAQKGKRAVPAIETRRSEVKKDSERLNSWLVVLESDDLENLENLERALGLREAREHHQTRAQRDALKLAPYRRFFSATGREIRVGKGDKENEALCFRHSKGDDFWFHASGYSGAHVVVPGRADDSLDPETLLDAASLAAHYSKARGEAEVIYTRIRYLRKPSRRQPGQVLVSRNKSLMIRLDAERIRRLMSTSPAQ